MIDPLPPRLYKYEPPTSQTLQNLKSQTIYFGSPRNFNDGFDCAMQPEIADLSDEDVELMRTEMLSDGRWPPEFRGRLAVTPAGMLRQDLMRVGRRAMENQKDDFLDRCGVTCFSEINDNVLMWAHYSGKSQGVCLEFDSRFDPLTKAVKVRYEPKFPSINFARDLDIASGVQGILRLYSTKSKDWAYEREWRAIHSEKNTKFGYEAQALTGVYFGPDASRESIEITCLVLLGQNRSVKFYRGKRSETEFRIVFEEFTYTSHLAAKKAGLKP